MRARMHLKEDYRPFLCPLTTVSSIVSPFFGGRGGGLRSEQIDHQFRFLIVEKGFLRKLTQSLEGVG